MNEWKLQWRRMHSYLKVNPVYVMMLHFCQKYNAVLEAFQLLFCFRSNSHNSTTHIQR